MGCGAPGDSGAAVALRQQLVALDRVAGRLARALALLSPPGGHGVWSGNARLMYVLALGQLSAQLQAGCSLLDEAIRDTRYALTSLADVTHVE